MWDNKMHLLEWHIRLILYSESYPQKHHSKLMFCCCFCFLCRTKLRFQSFLPFLCPSSQLIHVWNPAELIQTNIIRSHKLYTPKNMNPNFKDTLQFMTAPGDFTSMDLQVGAGGTSTSDAQQPVVASLYQSLEHWSSTSFQGPTCHEVLSISSLVPSTVLTLMPHCKPAAGGNLYPEPPSFSEITSEPQLPGTSFFPSGSSETQDQKALTSPLPSSDNSQEVLQRKPSDGGPLEEGSVGLILPKDLPDEEQGKN